MWHVSSSSPYADRFMIGPFKLGRIERLASSFSAQVFQNQLTSLIKRCRFSCQLDVWFKIKTVGDAKLESSGLNSCKMLKMEGVKAVPNPPSSAYVTPVGNRTFCSR
jgi:hypothetical protein